MRRARTHALQFRHKLGFNTVEAAVPAVGVAAALVYWTVAAVQAEGNRLLTPAGRTWRPIAVLPPWSATRCIRQEHVYIGIAFLIGFTIAECIPKN